MRNIGYISTTYELARELKNKEDGFLFAKVNIHGQEYDCVIDSIGRKANYANIDDRVVNYVLNMHECSGNIKR